MIWTMQGDGGESQINNLFIFYYSVFIEPRKYCYKKRGGDNNFVEKGGESVSFLTLLFYCGGWRSKERILIEDIELIKLFLLEF